MRFSSMVTLILILLLAAPPTASSEDRYRAAAALYAAGDFDAAAHAAGEIGSAEGHALAARALLAKAAKVRFEERLSVLKKAEAAADAAIAADPRVIEGYLQKLVAYSYVTRMPGFEGSVIAAATESREILDKALALEPANPWALATLGGWHLEVARRAPFGLGRVMFGASRAEGMKAFERALAIGPDNIVVNYEFGLALLWLDADRYRTKATRLFGTAIATRTGDAYSRLLQDRARRLVALTTDENRSTLEPAIAAYRGEAP